MIRYKLGLTGMEESDQGEFIRCDYHTHEINEYIRIDSNNRKLAESLLMEQDAELESKNKEIRELSDKLLSAQDRITVLAKRDNEIFKLELQVQELLNA